MKPWPVRILVGLIATAGIHAAVWRQRLPERVASHFDGAGNADGWMARDQSLLVYVGIVLFMGGLFAFLGPLLRRFPDSTVNLPDKEYWLAPERREETFNRIGDALAWMGVACCCLLVGMHELTFRANLSTPPRLGNNAWILLMVFLVVELAWTIRFLSLWAVPSRPR